MTRRWDIFCRVVDNYGDADGDDVYSLELPKTGGLLTVTLRTTNGELRAVAFDDAQNYVGEVATDKTKSVAGVYATMLAGRNEENKGKIGKLRAQSVAFEEPRDRANAQALLR